MMSYRLSLHARENMRSIARYTQRQWGREQRIKYIANLYDRFETVARTPLTGRPRNELQAGLRSTLINAHIIFYRIENDEILIVDILHQNADIPARSEHWT